MNNVEIKVDQTDVIIQQKSEGKDYEELLQLAIPEILKKLLTPKNTCKNHWDTLDSMDIFDLLDDEMRELKDEVFLYSKIDYQKTLSEFCDTAAFSLFGIVYCLEKLREDHKTP